MRGPSGGPRGKALRPVPGLRAERKKCGITVLLRRQVTFWGHSLHAAFRAGVARTRLSPASGVELAGWGYYLGRTWRRVRDHTAATALVLDDGEHAVALVAVDCLYADS